VKKDVPDWIRTNREKSGLSQKDLAQKLGLWQPQVSNWERGTVQPSREMLRNMAAIFGVEPDETPGVMELGAWLRLTRDKSGLTQGQLAQKAGISPITISFIETGQTESPQVSTLRRLEKVLGKLPANLDKEVESERSIEELEFLGPFPVNAWQENVGEEISCIYVFYDDLKRPVRIGETEDLRRRMKEYEQNYWWFRPPTVETFAYVVIKDPDFRHKTEKLMIKLVGENAIFNIQDKI
jgi:transcriptional regulator with XRE-family HTH domain